MLVLNVRWHCEMCARMEDGLPNQIFFDSYELIGSAGFKEDLFKARPNGWEIVGRKTVCENCYYSIEFKNPEIPNSKEEVEPKVF